MEKAHGLVYDVSPWRVTTKLRPSIMQRNRGLARMQCPSGLIPELTDRAGLRVQFFISIYLMSET